VGHIVYLKAMGRQKYSLPGKTQSFGPPFFSLVTIPNILDRLTCLLTDLHFFKVSRKKTSRTRGVHSSCEERIQKFQLGNLTGGRPVVRHKCSYDNIKITLGETECDDVDRIQLARKRGQWQ